MKTASQNLPVDEAEDFAEVDTFSTSLAPINRTEKLLFGLKDRICCVSVMAMFFALMRLLLSK
jgi:hypothetical protein